MSAFLLIGVLLASLVLPCTDRQSGERMVAQAATVGVKNVPVDQSVPKDQSLKDFKVVGYFPSWKPDKLACVDFDIVTHVCYAFAIPKSDGTLHAQDLLLTAAVISGATPDGNIYYDAAAQTNAVLNAVDFINVMAYDGDGERHSSYRFAVNCAKYWKNTRGLPARKVVLGVPFYARPSWADYGTIVKAVPGANKKDHVTYNGMDVYYNGVSTITKKARYAKKNLGGIMVWELTMDTANKKKSLLQAIGRVAHG